jgi:hypothetical protein
MFVAAAERERSAARNPSSPPPMSCVLRLTLPRAHSADALAALRPYRVEERAGGLVALHCDVSAAGFDAFPAQVADAVAFLGAAAPDLRRLTDAGAAAELDFAIEAGGGPVHAARFPAALVRAAGAAGVALAVTRYACADEVSERDQP